MRHQGLSYDVDVVEHEHRPIRRVQSVGAQATSLQQRHNDAREDRLYVVAIRAMSIIISIIIVELVAAVRRPVAPRCWLVRHERRGVDLPPPALQTVHFKRGGTSKTKTRESGPDAPDVRCVELYVTTVDVDNDSTTARDGSFTKMMVGFPLQTDGVHPSLCPYNVSTTTSHTYVGN